MNLLKLRTIPIRRIPQSHHGFRNPILLFMAWISMSFCNKTQTFWGLKKHTFPCQLISETFAADSKSVGKTATRKRMAKASKRAERGSCRSPRIQFSHSSDSLGGPGRLTTTSCALSDLVFMSWFSFTAVFILWRLFSLLQENRLQSCRHFCMP